MPIRFHSGFQAIKPDLPSARAVFPVPIECGSTVQFANFTRQFRQFPGEYQAMIMIRQYAPRISFLTMHLQSAQQMIAELRHSLRSSTYNIAMFVACRAQEIASVLIFEMRRAVPRPVVEAAKCEKFFALALVEFSPEIHRLEVTPQLVSPLQRRKLMLELQLESAR